MEQHDTPSGRTPVIGGADRERADRTVGDVDLTRWRTRAGRSVADGWAALGRRYGALPLLVLTLLVGIGIATTATWAASEVYDAVREADDVAVLDRPVLDWMLTLRSPVLDQGVTWWTDIAGTIGMPIVAVLFLIGFTVQRRAWTPLVLLVAASAGSLAMTIAGKDLIGRSRPPLSDAVPPYEHSPSFPSGHTLNSTVIVGTIVYLLLLRQSRVVTRVWTIVAGTLFVLSVGVSRVFLGHHWTTDVLAAWALGLAWLAVVITAHRLYLTALHRGAEPTPS
ncbi:phosphatidic acid phosphatase [Curtobacterium sp. MCJR17_055]|uniref:phosphatase PAP2 family protein n=1 Tax=unclassified Curtobacterium TaxID=257496 RepID=UPI000D9EA2B8|nr:MULTISPECIES: phosphatase PAP2 family protein [unclassified Curtobacterium]PYY37764.1 phosphatidic acid phosphatase [Curtobacterium sp. MCBD17_029]PYY41459.1 phosphatidic acid phosphatase [Curtobacterium sp. MCPF17_046]PYY51709.1 phosphatidic acid phosphatase [Curtobacterium sp. MCBD17_023]PYY56792.1 phosphatidic acid phosphatase [Curtobacterium sp. MCJR17_055]PYY62293.1 phosphatidic acid phosphatase [Curtobacterium sp. MCPF17_015]